MPKINYFYWLSLYIHILKVNITFMKAFIESNAKHEHTLSEAAERRLCECFGDSRK